MRRVGSFTTMPILNAGLQAFHCPHGAVAGHRQRASPCLGVPRSGSVAKGEPHSPGRDDGRKTAGNQPWRPCPNLMASVNGRASALSFRVRGVGWPSPVPAKWDREFRHRLLPRKSACHRNDGRADFQRAGRGTQSPRCCAFPFVQPERHLQSFGRSTASGVPRSRSLDPLITGPG